MLATNRLFSKILLFKKFSKYNLLDYLYALIPHQNIQKLLQVLHGALPKMSLIASDFSYLPDVKIPGERAPLVASKV